MSNVISNIPYVKDGDVFSIGGVEFIKFPERNGMVPAVARNIVFRSRFGSTNDLRASDVIGKLEKNFLPKIIAAIGEENLCAFKTDLKTLDGLTPYDPMEAKVSLPTFDFYRENVEIFDKYPVGEWWWLATPESTQPHCSPEWVSCVASSGYIYGSYYGDCSSGVRPFLSFNSSIFESCSE